MSEKTKFFLFTLVISTVTSVFFSLLVITCVQRYHYRGVYRQTGMMYSLPRKFVDSKTLEQKENQLQPLPPVEEKKVDQQISFEQSYTTLPGDLTQYTNKSLGFSFVYPTSYGEISYIQSSGETGDSFIGSFKNKKNIIFGGVSPDFTGAREGWFLDNQGYAKEGSKYKFKFVSGRVDDFEEGSILKEISAKNTSVLLVKPACEEDQDLCTLYKGYLGAIVNLPSKKFTGMAFRSQEAGDFDTSELLKIVKTIEVSK